MSDELAIELIRLRHRLRAIVVLGDTLHEANQALERFHCISESLGDTELLFEHARWRTHFEQLSV